MNSIYKIIGDFSTSTLDFARVMNDLSSIFYVYYKNQILLLSLINYKNEKEGKSLINKVFKRNYFIEVINERNIMNLDEDSIQWCREKLVFLDRQRYEDNNQEKLRRVLRTIDTFEALMEQKFKEDKITKEVSQ